MGSLKQDAIRQAQWMAANNNDSGGKDTGSPGSKPPSGGNKPEQPSPPGSQPPKGGDDKDDGLDDSKNPGPIDSLFNWITKNLGMGGWKEDQLNGPYIKGPYDGGRRM